MCLAKIEITATIVYPFKTQNSGDRNDLNFPAMLSVEVFFHVQFNIVGMEII